MAMHVHTRTRSPMRTNTGNAKALGALPPVAGDTVHMVAVSGAHTSGLPFPPPPPPAQRRAAASFFLGMGSVGSVDGWESVRDSVDHGRCQAVPNAVIPGKLSTWLIRCAPLGYR
uniref:Uncharacterized protein n=1 Tax=Eutreptiella gymnastica TaxID=73025 RepID=A0A7S1N806_9EUGL